MSQTVFRRVSNDTNNTPATPPFMFAYMQRPIALEHLTLLEAGRCWSFSPNRKKNPWKQNLCDKIVRVYPHFTSIPPFDSSSFEPFCWGKNLLYKPFHSIHQDIGTTSSEIISHWHHIKDMYVVWNVEREQEQPYTQALSDDSNPNAITFPLSHSMDEWELLSQMQPSNNI